MIIMRALVGTVLLIAVMLVSIVLINANTRPVRGAGSSKEVKEKSSTGAVHGQHESRVEIEVVESFEDAEGGDGGIGASVVEKVSEEMVQEDKQGRLISAIKKSGKQVATPQAVLVEIVRDDDSDEVVELAEGVVEEVLFTDGFTVDSHEDATDAARNKTAGTEQTEQSVEDDVGEIEIIEVDTEGKPEETRLESKPVQEIKTRSKEARVISTTEPQPASVPMGYEPSSYIIMDEEPLVEISKDSESEDEDLDPTESDASTKTLERKQRHADGTPETIILNKVPIIPYIKDEKRPVSPHQSKPLKAYRLTKRDLTSQHDPDHGHIRHHHQHHHHHQQGLQNPSVYNPYNWEKQNMNELRFPQCAACQKKSVPVCRTCGQCAECCHKSGCTCGCLHP
uniref:(northern house mosquito) hypothetical protein n=1 Tax=Culex pipiens TaxID=7175 RepID=A0A8D8GRU7_CULPI